MTDEIKKLKLIPPTDARVNHAIAPFIDEMLKDEGFKDRKELSEAMFFCMDNYAGIGLSANQVGLPFNMFVAGDHQSIENGMKLIMFNPVIISSGEEEVLMKEGCLTYPFLFLDVERPRKIQAKYQDEHGDFLDIKLDGMMSRIFQHEFDHMQGKVFTDGQSKMKIDMARKKAMKTIKQLEKQRKLDKS